MKWSSPVEMLAVAMCAAIVTPVISRASHPPVIPAVAHPVKATQSIVPSPGNAQYQFTTIDVPGTSDTEAYGINNTGLVSGFYVVNGTGHGFLWREGTFTPVDQGSGSNTLLGDVNESGTVAGNYGPFDSQNAAIYSIRTGAFTSLPPVTNLPINLGNGINSQGDVTGSAAMET